jgi:D-amino peptidase
MNILISADMEGVSGVTAWDHVTPGHDEWKRFREIMTADVNAAIQGAFEAGATKVSVSDGHWNLTNLVRERLDPRAWLNQGLGSPFTMMQGIGPEVNGVMMVGYHARAGTHLAILDHTVSAVIAGVWFSDLEVGEIGLNAAVAGHFGAPVIMLSGDQSAAKEVQELINHDVEVAVVKKARGRFAADLTPIALAQEKICEAAARAVTRLRNRNAPPPFAVPAPFRLAVEFLTSDMADRAEYVPQTERLSGRRVAIQVPDPVQAFRALRAFVRAARDS